MLLALLAYFKNKQIKITQGEKKMGHTTKYLETLGLEHPWGVKSSRLWDPKVFCGVPYWIAFKVNFNTARPVPKCVIVGLHKIKKYLHWDEFAW
jgi:hypothetical protein